jgi:PAS domain S-box-containing protein
MSGSSTDHDSVFRDLVDNLRAVFWAVPPDGSSILYCSPAYEGMWGRGLAELYAAPESWLEAVHPDDRARVAAAWRRAPAGYEAEYRVVRPDGAVTHVHDRAHAVLDAAGALERIVRITTDITSVRGLEEQLLHVEKMESLGRLAGGVAHEINNLLTIMLGQARLAREQPAAAVQHVALIEETARRGSELTSRLLGLTPSQPIRAGLVDVAAIARDQAPALRALLGPAVRLECALEPAPWPVRADAGDVRRLLLALAQNGADAMPDGGTLTIVAANASFDDDHARRHPGLAPGDHLVLTLTDTGTGVGEEHRSRVFEPFFSTRPGGGGMGLTTCYGIVSRAGGKIRLESKPGQGTAVTCSFPRALDTAASAPAPQAARRGPAGTVLVAEDEPLGREILGGVLRELGYDVVEAADGVDALAEAGGAHAIALLVTDVVMPRMGGRELAERLREQSPGLPVLFVSGYTDGALGDAGDPATAFLPKPFMAAELALAVRGLLDAEPAAAV